MIFRLAIGLIQGIRLSEIIIKGYSILKLQSLYLWVIDIIVLMKKILCGLAIAAALFTVSCSKDSAPLAENSWSLDQKKFVATSVTVTHSADLISAVNDNNSINIKFKQLPAANASFKISDGPYKENEIAVKCILSGSVVYNTINNGGPDVSVTVVDGKYTLILDQVKAINVSQPKDTISISAYISAQ